MAPFDIFVQDTTRDDAKASQIHDSLPGDLRKTTIRYDPHSKTWDILDSIFKDWAACDPEAAAVCLDLLFVVPHPVGEGKNLRARLFSESIYRVSNTLNLDGEGDESDARERVKHSAWGQTLRSIFRQYHKGPDQNVNQIQLGIMYIALPGVCSSNPLQAQSMLAWLLALPPIARVHFFETQVARAIVDFKWKAFGRTCTMTALLWFVVCQSVTVLLVWEMQHTLQSGKVDSAVFGKNVGMVWATLFVGVGITGITSWSLTTTFADACHLYGFVKVSLRVERTLSYRFRAPATMLRFFTVGCALSPLSKPRFRVLHAFPPFVSYCKSSSSQVPTCTCSLTRIFPPRLCIYIGVEGVPIIAVYPPRPHMRRPHVDLHQVLLLVPATHERGQHAKL